LVFLNSRQNLIHQPIIVKLQVVKFILKPINLLESFVIVTLDKNKKEELLELIKLYEKPATSHEKRVEEVVTQTVVEEKIVKKAEPKVKNPFIFKTEPYRKDYSRLVYWCNAFEPINKGKLASSQGWKRENPERSYY